MNLRCVALQISRHRQPSIQHDLNTTQAMSTYNVRIQIGNDSEKTAESTHTTTDIEQIVGQLKLDVAHKERIQKLKSGEWDREDLEVIPFYRASDWDSYEQYEEVVGGVSSDKESEGD